MAITLRIVNVFFNFQHASFKIENKINVIPPPKEAPHINHIKSPGVSPNITPKEMLNTICIKSKSEFDFFLTGENWYESLLSEVPPPLFPGEVLLFLYLNYL
ncbi:MAG: hypothetical protein IJV75_00525 [Alphaproteobacteria bacterium]|nr:hypothetical protein [Alphaproteobacteria bacterium]